MRKKFLSCSILTALSLALVATLPTARGGITFQFDYTYDTGNFFGSNPQAQTVLNEAASFFSSRLTDTLVAIDPAAHSISNNGTDAWTTDVFNPTDPGNPAANITVSNLTIPANTLLIYVGGSTVLSSGQLGEGGPGGWQGTSNGTSPTSWFNTLSARGQTGALAGTPTDFGPWGGFISFNSTATWYFDTDPSTNDVPGGKNDFYSVALHELGHVLGIGTAGSWDALISGGNLTGSNSEAAHGGNPVPLSVDLGHWAQGTTSVDFLTAASQEVAMDPSVTIGTRKYFTALDMAGLQDVGWQVVPEPAVWAWVAGAAGLGAIAWRRKKAVAVKAA